MKTYPFRFARSLAAAWPLGALLFTAASVAASDLTMSDPGARAPAASPTDQVDALNQTFGKQVKNRAVHAKGIVLEGRFTPAPSAAGLSRAVHFQQAVPVTIRFSDFAGIPTIPDNHPAASPRGLAIKFHLPGGESSDLVTHSFNGFPSPTADDFRQLMLALGTSGPDTPKPTPLDRYLAVHPIAKKFLESQPPPPVSYGTIAYYGVNCFQFTNARGVARFGRYRIVPIGGEQFLSPEEAKAAAPGYLAEEIRSRVKQRPVRFRFSVQLSGPGDKIDDPSIAWPETRELVLLGEIEITKTVDDSDAAEQALIFIPSAVPDGITPADPMILARSAAYPVSYARRHQ
jgi:catalase